MKTLFTITLLGIGLLAVVFLFTRTSSTPYLNHQWKPHRWMSEAYSSTEAKKTYAECKKHQEGRLEFCVDPARISYLTATWPDGKQSKFDICLEHGEFRRIEP